MKRQAKSMCLTRSMRWEIDLRVTCLSDLPCLCDASVSGDAHMDPGSILVALRKITPKPTNIVGFHQEREFLFHGCLSHRGVHNSSMVVRAPLLLNPSPAVHLRSSTMC